MIKLRHSYFEIACYVAAVLLLAIVFFYEYADITRVLSAVLRALGPFVVGFSIAYVLNRPLKWLESRLRLPRVAAVLFLYFGIIALISGFFYYYTPQLVGNGGAAIEAIVEGYNYLVQSIGENDYLAPILDYVQKDFGGFAAWATRLFNGFMTQTSAFVLNLTGVFLNLFFGTIISLYMLFGKEQLTGTLRKGAILIFKGRSERLLGFLGEVNGIFSHFISGLIVEAIIVGILAYLMFLALGLKYSLILATIVMCMNVIPYLGPIISAIPVILTTLTYDPVKAIWVAILILVLQQLDGNYIGPKVMGSFIGMEPIWVIFAISIGAGLGGIVGILLAIPTAAIIKIVWLKAAEQQV